MRIDPASDMPLYRQIYDALRRDILDGALTSGQRLAATRVMAEQLGVSRNTVLEAIDQLTAEGYLTSRTGSGTYVASNLPEQLLKVGEHVPRPEPGKGPAISSRGREYQQWASASRQQRSQPFQLGRPAVDRFPWKIWWRLMARHGRELPRDWLDYSPSAGFLPLRQALAHYLHSSRGLRCSAEQIVIVRGSQQGLDLAARVFLDAGDPVWMEDPGYGAARAVLAAGGAKEVPVPVDDEGLNVAQGRALEPRARLAYVTPSHQYPLGVTMSLRRRLELLAWARENNSWIIEDDYDSEYRFAGRPLASLAGLDGGRHVIYLGTLSKVLFPALRLGYLVVPLEHRDAVIGARYASDRHTFILEQAVAADFLNEGHFERHLRAMRTLYAERQRCFSEAVERLMPRSLDLRCTATGLHDVGWLKRHQDDVEAARLAAEVGVSATPLSTYCRLYRQPPALLFGYAGFPENELKAAAVRLADALEP